MQAMNGNMTRRLTLILGSIAAASVHAQTKGPEMAVHQEIDLPATPARVYEILLDAKQFAAFTKDTAEVQPRAGETFKLFGGRIEGRNVELIPNQRIVQAWRPAAWPPGVYSIVRFELVPHASGTRVVLDHAGFTADHWETLSEGWLARYWDPLHKYLNA